MDAEEEEEGRRLVSFSWRCNHVYLSRRFARLPVTLRARACNSVNPATIVTITNSLRRSAGSIGAREERGQPRHGSQRWRRRKKSDPKIQRGSGKKPKYEGVIAASRSTLDVCISTLYFTGPFLCVGGGTACFLCFSFFPR